MWKRLSFAIAAGAIALQACASAPSEKLFHITDSEQLFSAADWTSDLDTAAKSAGFGDRIAYMQTHLNEQGGWPAKLKDGDARWFEKDTVRLYSFREVARLTYYDQPAALLVAPASANQHMPEGWKPAEDFYIVIGLAGLPTSH